MQNTDCPTQQQPAPRPCPAARLRYQAGQNIWGIISHSIQLRGSVVTAVAPGGRQTPPCRTSHMYAFLTLDRSPLLLSLLMTGLGMAGGLALALALSLFLFSCSSFPLVMYFTLAIPRLMQELLEALPYLGLPLAERRHPHRTIELSALSSCTHLRLGLASVDMK